MNLDLDLNLNRNPTFDVDVDVNVNGKGGVQVQDQVKVKVKVKVKVQVLALFALAACSAPATLGELATAERRADAGDVDGAVAAYRAAQQTCKRLKPPRRARAACAEALLGEGEVLDRAGRT